MCVFVSYTGRARKLAFGTFPGNIGTKYGRCSKTWSCLPLEKHKNNWIGIRYNQFFNIQYALPSSYYICTCLQKCSSLTALFTSWDLIARSCPTTLGNNPGLATTEIQVTIYYMTTVRIRGTKVFHRYYIFRTRYRHLYMQFIHTDEQTSF